MFVYLLIRGMASLRLRPKMISAGDSLHSGSRLFPLVSRALRKLSLSNFPSTLMLFYKSLLVDLTDNSALPFDGGLYAAEARCLTFNSV